MGNSALIGLTIDADSIRYPGEKCVLSEDLSVYGYDALMEETIEWSRHPVHLPEEAVLKAVEVEEHSKEEFTVKVIFDGKKLKEYGFGKEDGSETDKVHLWNRVIMNREEMTVTNKVMVTPATGGQWIDEIDPALPVIATCLTSFNKEPLTLEYYIEVAGGDIITDDRAKGGLQPVIDSICGAIKGRKVKVRYDQPSIRDSGKLSCISAPLDEVGGDCDKFWTTLVDEVKATPGELMEISPEEFHKEVTEPIKMVNKHIVNAEKREMVTTTFSENGKVGGSVFIVHKEPFCFEAWLVGADDSRKSGVGAKRIIQGVLDGVLTKMASSGGWFW